MIELAALTKTFPNGRGIRDISLTVAEGEAVGFLGPNGAGKTTTIRHLLGFLRADAGQARIFSKDCFLNAAEIHGQVGYLPGEISLFPGMTAKGFLRLAADLRGLRAEQSIRALAMRFELDLQQSIRKMSKGTKQKVAILAAFFHDPAVYILDEPTSGLDPLMQHAFVELVQEERARGKTVFLSSHNFSEIDRLCDRVAIIKDGRLLRVDGSAELRAARFHQYRVEFANAAVAQAVASASVTGMTVLRNEGSVLILRVADVNAFLRAMSTHDVRALASEETQLEESFLAYYSHKEDAHE